MLELPPGCHADVCFLKTSSLVVPAITTSSDFISRSTRGLPPAALQRRIRLGAVLSCIATCLLKEEFDPTQGTAVRCRSGKPHRGRQPVALVAVRNTGLMWANMLRAFQVGNTLTSDGEPSIWMRPSRVAWAQVRWPACHLTNASASAVM